MDQHWKSMMPSVHNQRTSSSEKSGGTHCQILHYLLHINYLRSGNTFVGAAGTFSNLGLSILLTFSASFCKTCQCQNKQRRAREDSAGEILNKFNEVGFQFRQGHARM